MEKQKKEKESDVKNTKKTQYHFADIVLTSNSHIENNGRSPLWLC